MFTDSPQFIYLMLILPGIFGITLVGDGINKIVHEEDGGIISLVAGFVFLGVVVLIYFFFSNFLFTSI